MQQSREQKQFQKPKLYNSQEETKYLGFKWVEQALPRKPEIHFSGTGEGQKGGGRRVYRWLEKGLASSFPLG